VQEDYAEMVDLADQVITYVHKNQFTSREVLDAFLNRESQIMQLHYSIRAIHTEWVMKRVRQLLQEAGHPAIAESST